MLFLDLIYSIPDNTFQSLMMLRSPDYKGPKFDDNIFEKCLISFTFLNPFF
jgi:hypothetical protein